VPIVPAAIVFDLAIGSATWPGPEAGYEAAAKASREFETGSVGGGTGATVGKFLGLPAATKSGLGTACIEGPGGLMAAALVIVNALGNVVDPGSERILAGARLPEGGFADFGAPWEGGVGDAPLANTTVAVVATNGFLDRVGAYRMAQVAHDGLARAIRPVHTQYDGDTVFSLATGQVGADLNLVAIMAADALAAAVVQAVLAARTLGGVPARRDLAWITTL